MEEALDDETKGRLRLLFVATALMLASVLSGWLRPETRVVADGLALAAAVLVGVPIVKGLVTAIRSTGFGATQFYMDQYVVLALAACLATGRYLTGAVVAIVLLFGQMLEERTTVGVEMALKKLKRLTKLRARVKREESYVELDASELKDGDVVRVLPGEAVPADGVVKHGEALVDQSSITGESMPVEVREGSDVFAGTSNLNGAIEVAVTGTGRDTVMGRVQSIIEEAKESEAPIISLAEDYARYYTPLILLIAASVFFFTQEIERAIAVLVVAIPCAFVLASPSAMVSAIAAASRMGILVKSVRHLEGARMVDTVVFDKTGTLTEGRLELAEVLVHGAVAGREDALALAARIESRSNHPVARAVTRAAGAEAAAGEVEDLIERHGLGLEGTIDGRRVLIGRHSFLASAGVEVAVDPGSFPLHSLVMMAVDGEHAATFLLEDQLRPEVAKTLDRLRELGIERYVMLTGDRRAVAERISERTGISEFRAECLPEDKVRFIRELKEGGAKVLVVGDGLNDAPALAEADVGVAMGALGNDVTVHTSDVALMSGDLLRLPDLILLSARTVGIINQNLLGGFALIIVAIALSSVGFINPIMAAFFHEFSAFFVIFNSARLMRFEGFEDEAEAVVEEEPVLEPEAAIA